MSERADFTSSDPCGATAACRGGFSLVELMVAMSIGAVVLLVAASLLGRIGGDYGRISGTVGTEREARAAISQIAADAATARPHADQLFDAGSDGWPADRGGFLTLQPAAAQAEAGRLGDLCAVNYRLEDLMVGGRPVRCLVRGFRGSADTFEALRDGGIGGLFAADPRDEPIAFGVLGFALRPLQRAPDGSWQDWESSGEEAAVGPEALRVRLIVVTREMLGKMESVADWNGEGGVGRLLGQPDGAELNRNLRVYDSIVRFGQP